MILFQLIGTRYPFICCKVGQFPHSLSRLWQAACESLHDTCEALGEQDGEEGRAATRRMTCLLLSTSAHKMQMHSD